MTLVDGDSVDTTNRNRQLPALSSTLGCLKTEVVAARLVDINPHISLTLHQEFLDPARAAALVQQQDYSHVIDCIDSVAPKLALLLAGHAAGVPTISSMGAGGRLDPSRVRLADISDTYNDAFAAVVRKRLRKAGVTSGVTVVFSDEPARPASLALTQQQYKRSYFGTSSYIPALFGLYIASHVIRLVVEPGYYAPKAGQQSSRSSTGSALRSVGTARRKRAASADNSSSPFSSSDNVFSNMSTSSSARSFSGSTTSTQRAAAAHTDSDDSSIASGQDSKGQPVQHSQQHLTASSGGPEQQTLYLSFERAVGVGQGFDGEGL